ncbi:hypothetical protein ACGFX4_06565 [Kitasatospora sp. NPDC048365]|uniref:hypothetical protein n=1 Tax=Kitasatospora sp. NPDC048365 TaxID=3364050 RepID=UPI00371BC892
MTLASTPWPHPAASGHLATRPVLPMWLVTVPTVNADTRGGVQVFAVPAATVQEALTLAGDRATAPDAVVRRRGAAADLARATVSLSGHGFRV